MLTWIKEGLPQFKDFKGEALSSVKKWILCKSAKWLPVLSIYILPLVIKLQWNVRITTSEKEAQDMYLFFDRWKFSLPTVPYIWVLKTCSHWKCTSGLQNHIIFICLYALLPYMLSSDNKCTNHQKIWKNNSNSNIKKWHKTSICYVSHVKSETSNILRTSAWFLKPFGERLEENLIYGLVKANSTVKARTIYSGHNIWYQFFFLENGKMDFKGKI